MNQDTDELALLQLAFMGPMVTRDEVAERVKVSTRQVDRWLKKGLLPHIKIGGIVRIKERDLVAWINTYRNRVSIGDAALFLGLTPETVVRLIKSGELEMENYEGTLSTTEAELIAWRQDILPQNRIYSSITSIAQWTVKSLVERGINADMLTCQLCEEEGEVHAARVACCRCGEPRCTFHANHRPRDQNALLNAVMCDRCRDKLGPNSDHLFY